MDKYSYSIEAQEASDYNAEYWEMGEEEFEEKLKLLEEKAEYIAEMIEE